MSDDPIPSTFVQIAGLLDELSWEQRRRVLAGINAFYSAEHDPKPQPAATPSPLAGDLTEEK